MLLNEYIGLILDFLDIQEKIQDNGLVMFQCSTSCMGLVCYNGISW